MASAKEILRKINKSDATTYDDLPKELRKEIKDDFKAPPEIIRQGLEALKNYFGAF